MDIEPVEPVEIRILESEFGLRNLDIDQINLDKRSPSRT